MKSKPILSPQVKKRAHQYVDQQLCIERAYIAHCVLMGCAIALNQEFKFGKDRIQRFAAVAYLRPLRPPLVFCGRHTSCRL